jgi:hypothetical protein
MLHPEARNKLWRFVLGQISLIFGFGRTKVTSSLRNGNETRNSTQWSLLFKPIFNHHGSKPVTGSEILMWHVLENQVAKVGLERKLEFY